MLCPIAAFNRIRSPLLSVSLLDLFPTVTEMFHLTVSNHTSVSFYFWELTLFSLSVTQKVIFNHIVAQFVDC